MHAVHYRIHPNRAVIVRLGNFGSAELQRLLCVFSGSVYIGPNGELPSHALRRITADGEPNVIFDPDLSTFVIRENGTGKATAEILGSLKVKQNGLLVPSPYCPTPREVALSQLKRLEELDMYLLAGTEMEFYLLEKEQGSEKLKPLFQNLDIFNHIVFAEHEKLLFELENIIGDVETMHCEYGPGQFEFSLKAKEGIAAADKVFYFKYTVKEWCLSQGQREEVGRRRNLSANFMSKPYGSSNGSGAHFNHSIWRKSTGENMFADASDPEGLSSTAKHWVAGLVEHADALTALCCPTYNCYRRLHLPWAPDTASWGVDDRQASFRMVNRDTSTTYLENRIPGMASNPYIVMAATVAAGLDGVIRKLDCPSRGTQDAKLLVKDLGEALEALRRDEVMCSALGEGFIDAFIDCKTEVELTSFKHHDPSSTDEKQYQAEWNIYKHI